jgi:hypothetical protein
MASTDGAQNVSLRKYNLQNNTIRTTTKKSHRHNMVVWNSAELAAKCAHVPASQVVREDVVICEDRRVLSTSTKTRMRCPSSTNPYVVTSIFLQGILWVLDLNSNCRRRRSFSLCRPSMSSSWVAEAISRGLVRSDIWGDFVSVVCSLSGGPPDTIPGPDIMLTCAGLLVVLEWA